MNITRIASLTAVLATALFALPSPADTGTWAPAEMKDTYASFTDAANWRDAYVPTNANDSAVFDKVSARTNDRGSLSGNSWQSPIFGYVSLPNLASETVLNSISGIRQYRLRTDPYVVSPSWSASDVSDFLGTFELSNRSALRIRAAESGRTQQLHGVAIAGRPTLTVDGGTVELGQLSGAGTLQKSGSGALDLSGVSAAPGVRIHAAEGVVRLCGVPDAPSPVPGMALHLDASCADSITTNADGVVTAIADVRGGTDAGYRKATRVDGSPRLVDFGGLKLLNFGYESGTPGDTAALTAAWGTPAHMILDQAVPAVKSLFVVFRYNVADGNGANPFPVNDTTGNELRRPNFHVENSPTMSNTVYLVDRSATTMFLYQQYGYDYQSFAPQAVVTGDLRRDGESVSHRGTPRSFHDGLECFSLNVNTNAYVGGALPDLDIKYLARCQNDGKTGGCRIGEVLVYTNSLTDAEQKRNLDYLMAKWSGAEGRRHWTAGTLSGGAGASFDVAAGETAEVRSIDTRSGVFVKTGGGTLRARHVSGNGAIRVEGGSVEFVGGQVPAVSSLETSDPQPAYGISSRFDASAGTDYMVTETEGGTNFVLRWNSTVRNQSWAKYNLALMVTNKTESAFKGMRPFLAEDAAGRKWVDFGDLTAASSSVIDTPTSGWFHVTRTTDLTDLTENSVRELFWVWDPRPAADGANPVLFGGSAQWHRYAVPGKGTMLSSSSPYSGDQNEAHFLNTLHAQWAVDGAPVDPALDNWTAGPHVVRVSFGRSTYMTAIGCDYLRTKGGFRLGELLVYTRELTDRERIETEAYLLNKWKGAEHPDRAGAAPDAPQVVYAATPSSIAASEGASVRFSFADTAASARPALDTSSKTWIHIDASDLSTVSYAADANGDLRVSSIADPRGNGKAAANPYSGAKPVLRVAAQNGRNVIDLGRNGTSEASALCWYTDGTVSKCTSEISAAIVYANRDDDYYADPFSTFNSGNSTWISGGADSIFGATACQQARDGTPIYIDGGAARSSADGGYPSGFHLLWINNAHGWTQALNGVGANKTNNGAGGGMLFAEIYVFSSTPSAAERDEASAYLMKKWGIGGQSFDPPAISSVSAASGGTVVLDTPVSATALSGAGTIRAASVSGVSSLAAAMDENGVLEGLTFDGALAFASNGTATISLPAGFKPAPGNYPLVTGADLAEGTAETLGTWTVAFSPAVDAIARLVVEDGNVVLMVLPRATILYVR